MQVSSYKSCISSAIYRIPIDDRFTEEYSFARPENVDRQKISSKQILSHGVIFSFLKQTVFQYTRTHTKGGSNVPLTFW